MGVLVSFGGICFDRVVVGQVGTLQDTSLPAFVQDIGSKLTEHKNMGTNTKVSSLLGQALRSAWVTLALA